MELDSRGERTVRQGFDPWHDFRGASLYEKEVLPTCGLKNYTKTTHFA